MLEIHEEDITQWYFGDQKENLLDWLCVERVLDENEQGNYKKGGKFLDGCKPSLSLPVIRAAILLASDTGAGEEDVLQDGRSVK